MLWLAVMFPALPLEVFPACQTPFGVVEERSLLACDDKAKTYGLLPGMSVAQACALCPPLVLRTRDRVAEEALLEHLADFAYGLTPRIVVNPTGVLMNFTDDLSPVGDARVLISQVAGHLQHRGYRAHVALAPTAMGASIFARSGALSLWTHNDAWRLALRSLPWEYLSLPKPVYAACADLGLSLIGELLDLPRAGLRRRFGLDVVHTLERLMGERPEINTYWVPPPVFKSRIPLPFPAGTEDAVLYYLNRITTILCDFIRRRDAHVRQFTVALGYEDKTALSEKFTLARPERDAAVLTRLVRERLARAKTHSGIVWISLEAPFETNTEGNLSFWREEESQGQEVKGLLDRLRARLGNDAVRAVSWYPDYRPERAAVEVLWPPTDYLLRDDPGRPAHPLWLVDPPHPLTVVDKVPQLSGPLQFVGDPERLETGWWDGAASREYFVAVTPRAERLWIFKSPDGRWFLQGYFG